jgi:hypothetical protein
MIRLQSAALAVTLVVLASGPVHAQAPAPASAASPSAAPVGAATFRTDKTTIGQIAADPAAKAIVVKYLPAFADSSNTGMMADETLKSVQPLSNSITDDILAKIDADFAKLGAP